MVHSVPDPNEAPGRRKLARFVNQLKSWNLNESNNSNEFRENREKLDTYAENALLPNFS